MPSPAMSRLHALLRAACCVTTAGAFAACASNAGQNATGPSTGGTPTNIVKVSGDSQSGAFDATIPKPLVVKVTDSAGLAVTNASVAWLTTLLDTAQIQTITTTNASGQAQFSPLLGGSPGAFTVAAAINGHHVTFSGASNITLANGTNNITAGLFANCALTKTGQAFCWGNGISGQLGNGMTGPHTGPVLVSGGLTFTQISTAGNATCGIATGGALYCWGSPAYGNFGNASLPNDTLITTPIPVATGYAFSSVSVGDNNTCGLSGGIAYCWGNNAAGSDGPGDTLPHLAPVRVKVPSGVSFVTLAEGGLFGCGLTTAGAVYCWGSNADGGLGIGTSSVSYSDSALLVAGARTYSAIAAGNIGACALTPAGAAYCWGEAVNGNGTSGTEYAPTAVQQGSVVFTQISMLGPHACGLTAAGAAYCWGENTSGALGSGSFSTSGSTPVAVTGGLTFSTIAGGGLSTCGYTTSNTMYCWGANQIQQLGLAPTADTMYAVPQPVPGMAPAAP